MCLEALRHMNSVPRRTDWSCSMTSLKIDIDSERDLGARVSQLSLSSDDLPSLNNAAIILERLSC
jgi:hypothetical protein